MRDKNTSAEEFRQLLAALNDTDKARFSKLTNVLINHTFIIKDKESDRDDYFFLRTNRDLFTAFFELIDYEFVYDQYNEIIYIKTAENRNRVRLNKFETALVLILRQFYYRKKKEATSEGKTMVTLEEIKDKLSTSQVFKDDKKISVYEAALRKFRQHKIIDFASAKIDENTSFQILPSIQIIVPQDRLEDIIAKLSALRFAEADGGDNYENTDED